MDVLIFFAIPVFGVLWFTNMISLLEKMRLGRDYGRQKIWGSVLTFTIVLEVLYFLIIVTGY